MYFFFTPDVGGGKMLTEDIQAEMENAMNDEPQPVIARKVGEVLQTTLGVLGTAVNYPAGESIIQNRLTNCLILTD